MTTQAILDQTQNIADQQKKLCEMVAKEYPVGTRLIVELGGHQVTVEVTSHNHYWSQPGQLHGFNIHTGNHRRWMPSDIVTKL